jgi:cytochrome c oxidase subunit 4
VDFRVSTFVFDWVALMPGTARSETRVYIAVFFFFFLMTAVTVAVAYVDLQGANVVVALCIAALKAGLVVLVFMHARHSGGLVWATMLTGCAWVAILIGLTMAEVMSRQWLPS